MFLHVIQPCERELVQLNESGLLLSLRFAKLLYVPAFVFALSYFLLRWLNLPRFWFQTVQPIEPTVNFRAKQTTLKYYVAFALHLRRAFTFFLKHYLRFSWTKAFKPIKKTRPHKEIGLMNRVVDTIVFDVLRKNNLKQLCLFIVTTDTILMNFLYIVKG